MTEIEKLKKENAALKELLIDGCRVLYWCTDFIDGDMGQHHKRPPKDWFDDAWKASSGA